MSVIMSMMVMMATMTMTLRCDEEDDDDDHLIEVDADGKLNAYSIDAISKLLLEIKIFLNFIIRYLRESSASFNLDRNCEEVKSFFKAMYKKL